MSGFATARRIAAAAVCAAALSAAAAAKGEATAPARELALGEIRALAAIATAGRTHADPRCRALAASAGDLGAAALDALVYVDKSRVQLAVGAQPPAAPAIEDDYRRVAATAHDARDAVIRRAAACPELLPPTPR